jgi:hypothetical protein
MNGTRIHMILMVLAFSTGAMSAFGSAPTAYVTPTGGAVGNCPAGSTTFTPAQFNTSSNWGSGSSQIGSGTVVLVCGTITAAQNTSALIFQGSGTNSNPITLVFDTGAMIQSPAFSNNGAIYVNAQKYIVIDGGTNGIIRNTLNGSASGACSGGACSIQQNTRGVYVLNSTNVTVKNLAISNMYVRTANNGDPNGYGGPIQVFNNSLSGPCNIKVQNNIIHDGAVGIFYMTGSGDGGLEISGNEVYNTSWSIAIMTNTQSIAGALIHDNKLHDAVAWDDWPSPYNNHHNYVALFNGTGSATMTEIYVYNNEYYGNFGNGTAMNYVDNNSNGNASVTFFNNYIHMAAGTGSGGGNGAFTCQSESGTGTVTCKIYNNTVVGVGTLYAIWLQGPTVTPADIRNNIFSQWYTPWYRTNSASMPDLQDHNAWHVSSVGGNGIWKDLSNGYSTLPTWQSHSGLDLNSVLSNPLLNSNGTLQSGSLAISLSTNLTSLCSGNLTALCKDKAGNARPTSGAWDAGAFQYNSLSAPANLQIVPQ